MHFNIITMWFCKPCNNYATTAGSRFSSPPPTCPKCRRVIVEFTEFEAVTETKTERTNDEISRGFTFKEAISTKS